MLQKANDTQVHPIVFNNIRQWFAAYTASYFSSDSTCQQRILLKRNHSLRVFALAGWIGKQLRLSDEDIFLAKIIGLLHDVGRFEQFTRFQTFVDRYSFDHGDFGADLLKTNKFIAQLHPQWQETIFCAIGCHNKAAIPPDLDGEHLLHARLIRDADKLDNLRITMRNNANQKPAPLNQKKGNGDGVSKAVLQALLKKEMIDFREVRKPFDFPLIKVGWIYDINYAPSLQIVKERGYLAAIRKSLPDTGAIQTVFQQIDSHIHQRLHS